jgi:putative DNA primase/helicase
MFNLATDLPLLKRKIEEVGGVVAVFIDPVSSYLGVGKINNSSTTDVRGVLGPLTELAEQERVAVIGIMHFNKKADVTNAMLRIADSLAYVAAARHVYVVVDDAEVKDRRLLVKAKNNLAPDKAALSYMVGVRMVGYDDETGTEIWAPHVLWGTEHVEITATEAMQAEANGNRSSAKEDAEDFLRAQLAMGPVKADDLREAAKANSISEATLRRAKQDLGVRARKEEGKMDGQWFWEMPIAEGAHRD